MSRFGLKQESPHAPVSGGLDAYEFHIETILSWHCHDCGRHDEATNDIREDEPEAPYGGWARRKALEARAAGWYVPPLSENGSLVTSFCLCPGCAGKRGFRLSQD